MVTMAFGYNTINAHKRHLEPTAQPTKVPKFIRTLYTIFAHEDPAILAWSNDGTYFQIHNINRLEQQVLPRYFKHNKFASFQRQLNNHGFRKWTKTRASVCTFSHDVLVRCELNELSSLLSKTTSMPVSGKRARLSSDSSEDDVSSLELDAFSAVKDLLEDLDPFELSDDLAMTDDDSEFLQLDHSVSDLRTLDWNAGDESEELLVDPLDDSVESTDPVIELDTSDLWLELEEVFGDDL
ncbi:hypothetical protein Poli38472_005770 [Pythium oligandrum]|uniref:HSF-type DNA-binding domain-containing protein n=1 Tax=Pythium oligandrum TaxID=41045 RepID=A0A8K1CR63_PYTOL|nr:hypothetical protein Poli38472_005770 [Pythium oligandrum]|eukprot:TMW68302.1 hypothetical protein Poli38472_005770 [Pythium oligandrum]